MRHLAKLLKVVLLPAALLALAGSICRKVPERQWDRENFRPIGGRSFSLPSGLALVRMPGAPDPIPQSDLPLAMTISNTTGQRTKATLPGWS
jgi:hypothetical protein